MGIRAVAAGVLQHQQAKLKSRPSQTQQLTAELTKVEQQQASIIQQISDRAAEARPRLTALDDLRDRLELQRGTLSAEFANTAHVEPDMSERLAELRRQINPEAVPKIMALFLYFVRDDVDTTTKQPFVDMTRKRLKLQHEYDFQQRLKAGELDTEAKRKKLLSDYAEELDKKKLGWVNLQVSLVAGAGFEPAAFRL
ncbi:hypothetical protein AX761_24425 [Rhizobium sp. 58]|nr:hypothetical protein AX761_24425 [Rhizobium sp. 58]